MAEIDTSIYQNQVKPPDMLGTLSGVAGLQTQLNQNKLFQQELNSKLGLSQIYKDAIGPNGQLDPSKIPGLINGPTGANVLLGLPEAYAQSQAAQQRNIGIDTSQLENKQKHIDAINRYMAPLLASPNPTASDIVQSLAHAVTAGVASTDEASQIWAQLPRDQGGQVDEGRIKPFLQAVQMQMMSPQERMNATSPAPQMVNTGQQQIPMRFPQIGQPSQAGPGIQNQLPPNTPIFNSQTNAPGYLGAIGGAGGRLGTGGGQSGSIASGPALGAAEAAGVDATASANQGIQLQSEADQVPAQKALLGNLEGALDRFTPGPGQGWKNEAAKFVNANNPFGQIFDPSKIASQEEFNKQAVQLAQAQFKTLGGTGTDSKLDSAMHTSPNEALSKMGNKGIIAMLKGNADAVGIKNQEWQDFKQTHGPQSYGQFSTQFNKTYDPRVFQSQYLTTDDRKKMIGGMSKDEQKSFLNSYRTALSNGWVKLPGGK